MSTNKDKNVEEKDKGKKDDKADASKKVEEKEKPVPPTPTAEIKSNIALIERAVADLEPRFTHRVLRSLTALRKRLDNKILRDALEENYPTGVYPVDYTYMSRERVYRVCGENIAPILAARCITHRPFHGHRCCCTTQRTRSVDTTSQAYI